MHHEAALVTSFKHLHTNCSVTAKLPCQFSKTRFVVDVNCIHLCGFWQLHEEMVNNSGIPCRNLANSPPGCWSNLLVRCNAKDELLLATVLVEDKDATVSWFNPRRSTRVVLHLESSVQNWEKKPFKSPKMIRMDSGFFFFLLFIYKFLDRDTAKRRGSACTSFMHMDPVATWTSHHCISKNCEFLFSPTRECFICIHVQSTDCRSKDEWNIWWIIVRTKKGLQGKSVITRIPVHTRAQTRITEVPVHFQQKVPLLCVNKWHIYGCTLGASAYSSVPVNPLTLTPTRANTKMSWDRQDVQIITVWRAVRSGSAVMVQKTLPVLCVTSESVRAPGVRAAPVDATDRWTCAASVSRPDWRAFWKLA